jgi:hypothetical protein
LIGRGEFIRLGGAALLVSAFSGAQAILPRTAGAATSRHPRLLAREGGFNSVRRSLSRNRTGRRYLYYRSLLREAGQIINRPPSRYGIPDPLSGKQHLLYTSRQVLRRVYVLGLLYRLTGRKRYALRGWRELYAAARFPDWYPKHFLSTAEMTHAVAIGYDWLYGYLKPHQRKALREAIYNKGIRPALRCYRGMEPYYGRWVNADTNWNLVCNSGIGIGALAIRGESGRQAKKDVNEALSSATRSLSRAMRGFSPDGGWSEGYTYWSYGTCYATAFCAALETANGAAPALQKSRGFPQTGFFPLYLTGPRLRIFDYGDTDGDMWKPTPHLYRHSRVFDRPVYVWLHHRQLDEDIIQPHPLDVLWYDPRKLGPVDARLPRARHFSRVGVVTMRSGWEDPEATFVGFKATTNRANHTHLDQGTFTLDALGERWAASLPGESYNAPGYNWRSGRRWEYYRARAEGHNTLVINPTSAPDQDPEAAGRITRFVRRNQRGESFAIADLTALYRGRASRVHRGIKLLPGGRVIVRDEINSGRKPDIWWFMHTRASVELRDNGRSALLSLGNTRMLARITSPDNSLRFSLMHARPLPTSPKPEQSTNRGVRKLVIRSRSKSRLRLSVSFTPLRNSQQLPKPIAAGKPLSRW